MTSPQTVRESDRKTPFDAGGGALSVQGWLASWQHEYLFYQLDADQRITFIAPSVRSILGYDPTEMVGRPYREFIDLDHPLHMQLQDLSDRLLGGGAHGLRRCVARCHDGRLAFLAVRERPLIDDRGERLGLEVMAHDETARVNAEFSLRQSERKYRRLVEGLKGDYVIYSHNADGVITYVSPSVRDVLGMPPDVIVGKNWRDLVGQDSFGRPAADRVDQAVEHGKTFHKLVVEIKHADGTPRLVEIQERPVFGFDGQYQAMEGIAKDVTEATLAARELQELREDLERRVAARTAELSQANAELRRSETRYRNVVETQAEFITRWRPDGTRTFVNEAYCRYYGKTREKLLDRSFVDLIHEDDREVFHNAIASLTPQSPSTTYVVRTYRSDGEIAHIQVTDRAFFDSAGNPLEYQSVGRDVTALHEADERLREQETLLTHVSRLATMGEMVAGIAHEVHQPLHAARTFAEAARRHLEKGTAEGAASAVECTREIEAAINRTVSIIRRLRNFTKSHPVKLEHLDLNEVLQESIEMTAFEARRAKVRQSLELGADLPLVAGDRVQLQQVLVNLMLNAYEAMGEVEESNRRLKISTAATAEGVDVAFCDSGPGVAPAASKHVFDAFFTTKESGMGMGLALCKSIAAAHRAQLQYASNDPEPGCTFHLHLPRIVRPVP
ncbi:MAG: PAS domain S-box protein [Planctomycetales bacterium]|nr:PAS domain S-box protein [Planctomycetales bacterium]